MKRRCHHFVLIFVSLSSGAALAQGVAEGSDAPVGKVTATMGHNFVLRDGEKIPVTQGLELFRSDQVLTTKSGVVRIVFADGSSIVAMKQTSFEVEEYHTRALGKKIGLESVMGLVRGQIKVFIKPRDGGHSAVVKTKNAVMGVRGTEFVVSQLGEGDAPKETQLVVLSGSVALSPLKEDDNDSAGGAKGFDAEEMLKNEVVVKAGESSRVEGRKAAETPVKTPPQIVAAVAEEQKVLSTVESIPDQEVVEQLVLPPPEPKNAIKSRALRQENEKLMVLNPRSALAENSRSADQSAARTNQQESKETVGKSSKSFDNALIVIPRDAKLMTEIGLGCDSASLDRLIESAAVLGAQTELIAKELVACENFQDSVVFWSFFYHKSKAENKRALDLIAFAEAELKKLAKETRLDSETPREKELALFRAKEGAELLKRAKKQKPADKGSLLVAARAFVIAGSLDQALKVYDEVLSMNALAGNHDAAIEKAYVLLLKGDFAQAGVTLEDLNVKALTPTQKIVVASGLQLADSAVVKEDTHPVFAQNERLLSSLWEVYRPFPDAQNRHAHVGGFAGLKNSSFGWNLRELGAGWLGRLFLVDASVGQVKIGRNAYTDEVAKQAQGGSLSELNSREKFSYARLGFGARYIFSSGAIARAQAAFYGSEFSRFGGSLEGFYPAFNWLDFFVLFSSQPQYTEFISLTEQATWNVLRLAAAVAFFDSVTLKMGMVSREQGGANLEATLTGKVPVHRTARPDNKIDVVLEGRYLKGAEQSDFLFTPKQETSVLGGLSWNWKYFGTFGTGFQGLFGYKTREAWRVGGPKSEGAVGVLSNERPSASAAGSDSPEGDSSAQVGATKRTPWLDKETVPAETVVEAQLSCSYDVSSRFQIALDGVLNTEHSVDSSESSVNSRAMLRALWNF